MLNIIHRLKSGTFPALFFLTSASVLAQPLTIPPGHWQEGMAVGGAEYEVISYSLSESSVMNMVENMFDLAFAF